MKKELKTKHGNIALPAFMPDATYGSIKAVSFADAAKAGVKEIVTTTLHLEQKIGSKFIEDFGGVHKFFGWDRPILTDSGGWQVFSLINSKKGNTKNKISELGCSFVDPQTGKFDLLTAESSIQIQNRLGADIMTVLDNPILGDSSLAARKKCVEINTKWAKRAKKEFEGLRTPSPLRGTPPLSKGEKSQLAGIEGVLLGAVIQGGDDFELRKRSAEELIELDFDIYNFGGIPLNSGTSWLNFVDAGKFYHEMLHFVAELIPEKKIKYAMGVGQPEDIAYCVDMGWNLFDTVLPTRNARHGYLYVSEGQGDSSREYKRASATSPDSTSSRRPLPEINSGQALKGEVTKTSNLKPRTLAYDILHLRSERYKFDEKPVDEHCDCECCKTVSRSYLRHLIRIKEPAGQRLATIHNLRFYAKWMEEIRIKGKN